MKKFAFCVLVLLSTLVQAQPLVLEVWVRRVAMDSTGTTECFKQTILAHVADDHFGMISGTDTLALKLEAHYTQPPIWVDLISGDKYSILKVRDKEGHFLLILTPITTRRRPTLMLSTRDICHEDRN